MLHINKSDTRSMPVLRQEEASGFGGSRKQASSVAARGVEITSLKPDVGGHWTSFWLAILALALIVCSTVPKLRLRLEMNGPDMHSAHI